MNKKDQLITRFKAVINVRGKLINFSKSYSTPQRLINAVRDEGIDVANIIRVETFEVWG